MTSSSTPHPVVFTALAQGHRYSPSLVLTASVRAKERRLEAPCVPVELTHLLILGQGVLGLGELVARGAFHLLASSSHITIGETHGSSLLREQVIVLGRHDEQLQ
jgi:hypothetical protein